MPAIYNGFNFNVNISDYLYENRLIKEIEPPSKLTFEMATASSSRIISMETALCAVVIMIYQHNYDGSDESVENDYLDKLDHIRYNYRHGYENLTLSINGSDAMSRGSSDT